MKTKKILHIAGCANFIPPYINIINESFNPEEHDFMLSSGVSSGDLSGAANINLMGKSKFSKLKHYVQLIQKMHQAEKVIVHSLFNIKIVLILFFMPWLLKKCYWVIWGGDLYVHKLGVRNNKWKVKELFRRTVIKNIGNLVTYIEGDVALARAWYGAKGDYHECLMYTSNLYKKFDGSKGARDVINILVGNSADPNNNHINALEKLLPFKEDNINIFVPLSYGEQGHAREVIKQGLEWFGHKFKPLTEFMSFNEYLAFLDTIDIAIFNHDRQQAMGNTITLLGLGKTVYIRANTTQWQFFKDKGIVIKNVEKLSSLRSQNLSENVHIIKTYFSKGNYLKQLKDMFS